MAKPMRLVAAKNSGYGACRDIIAPDRTSLLEQPEAAIRSCPALRCPVASDRVRFEDQFCMKLPRQLHSIASGSTSCDCG
ncbi:hypothetical protein RRG08_017781 [Elysia crispata]|uniref:Uncharacterized protein n=1 Tax=Elysia crispata TaxID=231223 RepID=A0AAE0YXI3_9GAST|nr:hypothetical protein RRG08_017781 [Elysia crispata]